MVGNGGGAVVGITAVAVSARDDGAENKAIHGHRGQKYFPGSWLANIILINYGSLLPNTLRASRTPLTHKHNNCKDKYILLDVLMCSIVGYFYESRCILASDWRNEKICM